MEYKSDLKCVFNFELKSIIGRRFFSKKPKLFTGKNYLNLGSGTNYVNGYINADFFCNFKFWKKNKINLDWEIDLRYPLTCDDGVFDGVFTEHTLEHLFPDEAHRLLKELFRVMRYGSTIRITVPDLEKYILFYNQANNEEENFFKNQYLTGCSAIRNITQNYYHVSVWDFNELNILLKKIGFRDIKKMQYAQTKDEKLNLDIKERSWETLYVEAIK